MSRSAFIALCISVLILGGFALFSQNYRAGVEQNANQAPIVASAAVPTDSPLDAPNVEASFVLTPPSVQFRQPQQAVLEDGQPTIYLAFDQPVDETSVVEALHVSPTTRLDLKWTANTLYIQPVSPLTADKAVRRERVSFFVTAMNGEWRVDYLARALTTGTFAALPTEVYPMYDTAVWGRSASSQLVVYGAD